MTRTRLVTAVLAATALLTACGSDEDKPLTDAQGRWVDAFCGGVLPGLRAGQELQAQDPADPAAVKAAYLKLVTANAAALTDAVRELTELGSPSDELRDVHDGTVRYFTESAKSYEAAKDPITVLAADAGFWDDAEQVLARTSQVSTPEQLRATFDALERSPKYAAAVGRSRPCSELKAKQ
ncbi:hypothetical protein ACVDFE_04490 [Lentzea chajnantorensis]